MAELIAIREFARRAGCDPKQVRRAIESGALTLGEGAKLDASLIDGGWRRPRRDTRELLNKKGEDIGEDKNNVLTKMSSPAGDSESTNTPQDESDGEGISLKEAIARKELYAGRLKELEYRQRTGELVEMALARQILFDEFRSARDAWLNWPTRFAALIATDLGIEQADRVSEVLSNYVHKQLTVLAEPRGEFIKS